MQKRGSHGFPSPLRLVSDHARRLRDWRDLHRAQSAGAADPGIRSTVADSGTNTVAKGDVTRDILAAPEGDGREAQAKTPGN